ncbi:MAG: DUF3859 domain-containing protein [Micropepsaceae bacterium]
MRLSNSAAIVLIFATVFAPAHAASVEGIRILAQGVYTCDRAASTPDPRSPTGMRPHVNRCRLDSETSTIVARLGTSFGCTAQPWGITQRGHDNSVAIDVRFRYPVGVKSPFTGKTHYWDDTSVRLEMGASWPFTFSFEENFELMPGNWAVELWSGGHKFNECRFTVVLP